VRRLSDKVTRAAPTITEYEALFLDDAEIVVIAYGCVARSAARAVREARKAGIRAGLFRPITLWPFPAAQIRDLDQQARAFVVAELNLGQVAGETERFTRRPVHRVTHAGGLLLHPDTILHAIREAR